MTIIRISDGEQRQGWTHRRERQLAAGGTTGGVGVLMAVGSAIQMKLINQPRTLSRSLTRMLFSRMCHYIVISRTDKKTVHSRYQYC